MELSGATAAVADATHSIASKEGLDAEWTLRKVRCIGKRAITVFEIRYVSALSVEHSLLFIWVMGVG